MSTPLYAIKHLPSGGYLPAAAGSYTHTEPTAKNPPRLFTSERAAKLALRQWLAGPLVVNFSSSWSGIDGYDEHEERSRLEHSRNSDEMRVVEMLLRELEP